MMGTLHAIHRPVQTAKAVLTLAALCAAPALAQDGEPEWAAMFPETPTPVERLAPVYPPVPNRLGVQASCSMVYEVNLKGLPHEVCGACDINAPIPPGITPPPGALDRITGEFLEAARTAVLGWTFQSGDPGARYATIIRFELQGDGPGEVPAPPRPDTCIGQFISQIAIQEEAA